MIRSPYIGYSQPAPGRTNFIRVSQTLQSLSDLSQPEIIPNGKLVIYKINLDTSEMGWLECAWRKTGPCEHSVRHQFWGEKFKISPIDVY